MEAVWRRLLPRPKPVGHFHCPGLAAVVCGRPRIEVVRVLLYLQLA